MAPTPASGPYYVVIRLWTTIFGDSDLSLRLPSLFATAGAAAVIGLIGKRLGSTRVGLLAGLTFAILPITTRFGQEARPYSLAVLFVAIATLLLIRMLDGFTLGIAMMYAAALAAVGLMHLVAMLIVAAHGLAVLILKRKLLWRWVPSALGGILPLIPIILAGRRQQGNQIGWIPFTDLHQIEAYGLEFFGGALIGGAVLGLGVAAVSRERGAVVGDHLGCRAGGDADGARLGDTHLAAALRALHDRRVGPAGRHPARQARAWSRRSRRWPRWPCSPCPARSRCASPRSGTRTRTRSWR